jgi:hypothetical protein
MLSGGCKNESHARGWAQAARLIAYEYGEFASERDDATQHGIYLCIWRLESDGAWKIALDLQKSALKEKP